MSVMDSLKSFISRVEEDFKYEIQNHYELGRSKANNWRVQNPERHQEAVKRYSLTEKGRIANERKRENRKRIETHARENLNDDELKEIRKLYRDCPDGYEVDHIIPISRGGEHSMSNLQLLPQEINARKGLKLPSELVNCTWYHPYLREEDKTQM